MQFHYTHADMSSNNFVITFYKIGIRAVEPSPPGPLSQFWARGRRGPGLALLSGKKAFIALLLIINSRTISPLPELGEGPGVRALPLSVQ
jgi:hypothetical protein